MFFEVAVLVQIKKWFFEVLCYEWYRQTTFLTLPQLSENVYLVWRAIHVIKIVSRTTVSGRGTKILLT